MARECKVTRGTLAKYAALLGRDSFAAELLAHYDAIKRKGASPVILMNNNGFWLQREGN